MTESQPGPALADLLPAWVATQRWYPHKPQVPVLRRVGGRRYADPLGAAGIDVWIARDVRAATAEDPGAGPVYQIPVTYRTQPDPGLAAALIGVLEHPSLGTRWVYDGPHDPAYVRAVVADLLGADAELVSHEVLRGEQSNTSVIARLRVGDPVIVKILRVLAPGAHPDVEIPAALHAAGSGDVPAPRGHTECEWSAPRHPAARPARRTLSRVPPTPGALRCNPAGKEPTSPKPPARSGR